FNPAAVRTRRKIQKREEEPEAVAEPAAKKADALKKKPKKAEVGGESVGSDMGDVAEMEDMDDIVSLEELSELEEREEPSANGDDADDESIIEDLAAGEKVIVGTVEEEEAEALVEEIEDEEKSGAGKKKQRAK